MKKEKDTDLEQSESGECNHPLPSHSEDGTDLTLIRMMRQKSYSERLRTMQQAVNGILRLRRGTRIS